MNRVSLPMVALALPLFALACTPTSGAAPSVPSANADAGSLGPDFALDEGDAVIANADVKLARTYWTVVRAKTGSHYLLPRPDGAASLAKACSAEGSFATKLADHALCNTADSEEAVTKVNTLDADLAREVSTTLHAELRFRRDGDAITPAPLGRDILELCRTDAALRGGAMKERCDDEEKYADGSPRPSIFRMYTEAELDLLPAALNTLYGVTAD